MTWQYHKEAELGLENNRLLALHAGDSVSSTCTTTAAADAFEKIRFLEEDNRRLLAEMEVFRTQAMAAAAASRGGGDGGATAEERSTWQTRVQGLEMEKLQCHADIKHLEDLLTETSTQVARKEREIVKLQKERSEVSRHAQVAFSLPSHA